MRTRMVPVLVMMGCLVALVACNGDRDDSATAEVVTATDTSDIGPQLPRSVGYAGLSWTITAATIDPNRPEVRLDITVASSLGQNVTYPVSLLALSRPGKALVRAEHFLIGSGEHNLLQIGSGEKVSGTAVFEPPDTVDLSAVSFTIDAEDATPALLPLAGPVPPDLYPLVGTTSGQSDRIPDWEGDEAQVVVEAQTVKAALDYGAHRAPRGSIFVIIDVRIFGAEGTPGARVNDEFFRLQADGINVGPTENFNIEAAAGTSKDIEMAFSVPLGATTMTLVAGQDGTRAADFPVSIPPQV